MIVYYQFYTYTTINIQYPTFVVFKYAGLWYRERQVPGRKKEAKQALYQQLH